MKRIKSKFRNKETANDQLYVDLGLPSGLKWAKCNVGAQKETDYGIMFAWGQTDNAVATKFVDSENYPYSWATYKYYNGTSNTLTKYNNDSSYGIVDNKTVLDPEDDAVTQIMGSDWRMPTEAEWQELLNNTTNEWTQVNGVNGRKFTASNGNSIFIPAAGSCGDGSVDNVGYVGDVWSSSLSTSRPNSAWYLNFDSDYCIMVDFSRCYGRSVRGVMD